VQALNQFFFNQLKHTPMKQPEKIIEAMKAEVKDLGEIRKIMKYNGYTSTDRYVEPSTGNFVPGTTDRMTFGNVVSNKLGKIEAYRKVLGHE
jgi:hypothetical protein